MIDHKNDSAETTSILEIHTVESHPISLVFSEDYVKCPICDIDIDVKGVVIDNGSLHIAKIATIKLCLRLKL